MSLLHLSIFLLSKCRCVCKTKESLFILCCISEQFEFAIAYSCLKCNVQRRTSKSLANWPVRCIIEIPMVCERLTRKPRVSTILSWNLSSQWAVERKRGQGKISSESPSTDSLSKDYGWYSRLKNMALTIMAPSGFCTSLVISGSLPSVALAAHSLMEFTALLLSLKLIFEWS